MTQPRKLRVFLCHIMPVGYSSQDTTGVALRKPIVRELYQQLLTEVRIYSLTLRT